MSGAATYVKRPRCCWSGTAWCSLCYSSPAAAANFGIIIRWHQQCLLASYHQSDGCCIVICRFQIISLPGGVDSDLNNGSWRVGDWADTLELPNIGFQAIVRWIPGPVEITGESAWMMHLLLSCY